MDILIFSGQSNMQGQTEALSENEVVKDAFEYKFLSDTLSPLKNPVGEDIRPDGTAGYVLLPDTDLSVWKDDNVLGSACYKNTNMVPEFCRAYVKETNSDVVAVHAAKGSTEISCWLPGSECFDMMIKKSVAAINKVKSESEIGHIYFIWLQGESDAFAGVGKDEYKKDLISLYEILKNRLGIDSFAIIRVGRFTNDERDFEIINAQSEVVKENTGFLMLTEIASELYDKAEYINPFVAGHYSAKGQELIGKTAGKALGEFAKQH